MAEQMVIELMAEQMIIELMAELVVLFFIVTARASQSSYRVCQSSYHFLPLWSQNGDVA